MTLTPGTIATIVYVTLTVISMFIAHKVRNNYTALHILQAINVVAMVIYIIVYGWLMNK